MLVVLLHVLIQLIAAIHNKPFYLIWLGLRFTSGLWPGLGQKFANCVCVTSKFLIYWLQCFRKDATSHISTPEPLYSQRVGDRQWPNNITEWHTIRQQGPSYFAQNRTKWNQLLTMCQTSMATESTVYDNDNWASKTTTCLFLTNKSSSQFITYWCLHWRCKWSYCYSVLSLYSLFLSSYSNFP